MFHLFFVLHDICKEIKHHGHFLTDYLIEIFSVVKGMLRPICCLVSYVFCQWEMLMTWSFLHTWESSVQRLIVAYNHAMGPLLQVPRWPSASQRFVFPWFPTSETSDVPLNCLCRLDVSEKSTWRL